MKETIKKLLNYLFPAFIYSGLKIVYHWLNPILIFFYKIYFRIKLISIRLNHKKALKIVQRKNKIKVAFLLIHDSVWKYDDLYKLFEGDKRFNPVVVICPYIVIGGDKMRQDMDIAYNRFAEKGFNVVKSYDALQGKWLNIHKEINPDLVFFTNPYTNLTYRFYTIKNFINTLTFYVPYGYMITNRPEMQYNQDLHNLVFKIFHESEFQHNQAIKFSKNSGKNSIVTGYPGLDKFFEKNVVFSESPWKSSFANKKRIIWAPHHTIESEDITYNYSNFLMLNDFMLELATLYEEHIIFAFKPHPLLKGKLYELKGWGIEKTNAYYNEWRNRNNCQLNDGEYDNLFISSDAMIHDSGSFLVEYISLNKPSLYSIRNNKVLEGFSELGNRVIDCHYLAFTKQDIIQYIDGVVLGGDDILKGKREKLINNYLLPPNGVSATQNIFDEICKLL